jgi:hypothetical protein
MVQISIVDQASIRENSSKRVRHLIGHRLNWKDKPRKTSCENFFKYKAD